MADIFSLPFSYFLRKELGRLHCTYVLYCFCYTCSNVPWHYCNFTETILPTSRSKVFSSFFSGSFAHSVSLEQESWGIIRGTNVREMHEWGLGQWLPLYNLTQQYILCFLIPPIPPPLSPPSACHLACWLVRHLPTLFPPNKPWSWRWIRWSATPPCRSPTTKTPSSRASSPHAPSSG